MRAHLGRYLLTVAATAVFFAVAGFLSISAAGAGPTLADESCRFSDPAIGSFVRVNGGGFIKAADPVYPEEGQPRKVYVSPFLLQVHEVTNNQFAKFVEATGYVTEAEKTRASAVFGSEQRSAPRWRLAPGATWRSPDGEGSDLEGRGRHPVVHVTLADAKAYADWAGGRIPNEVEWEYAASLGLFDPDDPESGVRGPDGQPRANTWNGEFPTVNTEEDGFAGTAPVGCFEANLIGAYDMIGNVWEWTETQFGPSPRLGIGDREVNGEPRFTIKGGSFLCSPDFCRRYRAAARQSLEQDFSTAHVGFRIVKDVQIENGSQADSDESLARSDRQGERNG